MNCPQCGKEVSAQDTFCPSCGAHQAAGQPYTRSGYQGGPELKSKLVAGLLGIFVGELGIHRFYLGYTGIGIVQILVTIFTLGLGGLWGFIEGILILTGSFNKDAQGRPLKD
jgi:TM2 domain-containing membrane protein YozV